MDDGQAFSIISRRLQPGEKLIWHGVPTPLQAAQGELLRLGFMTIWTGIAAFGLYNAIHGANLAKPNSASPVLLVTSIFCIIGTIVLLRTLKSILDCWQIAYGLTDRRIIIAAGESGKTQSFTAGALTELSRSGDDRKGSLLFDQGRKGRSFGYRSGLYGIADPARVESLIYRTLITPNKQGAAV